MVDQVSVATYMNNITYLSSVCLFVFRPEADPKERKEVSNTNNRENSL